MDYNIFRIETKVKYGKFFSEVINYFFTNASLLAIDGNTKDALRMAELIKNLMPFTDLDNSEKIYIVGFLGDIYIDNNMLEDAEKSFNIGMQIIRSTAPEKFRIHADKKVLEELSIQVKEATRHDINMDLLNTEIIDNFLDLKLRLEENKKNTLPNNG